MEQAIKKAIKKAIEGGYEKNIKGSHSISVELHKYKPSLNQTDGKDMEHYTIFFDDGSSTHCNYSITDGYAWKLIDPLFWQALGKQQGWNKSFMNQGGEIEECDSVEDCEGMISGVDRELWVVYWHEFIDHIAQGKPIDEFFNNLIK